jgi:hypothetical protein
MGLLLAETGRVVSGTLSAGEPVTVKIGGKAVAGTKYVLDAPDGRAELVVNADGVLLSSEIGGLGGDFRAVAKTLPAPRSFGTIDVVETPGAGVTEEAI